MKQPVKGRVLLCGFLGCLCFGGGDWLMMYGDPAHTGPLIFLTAGTAAIPQWRYMLAMALAFPGAVLSGIALFALSGMIAGDRERRIYRVLNAFGLMPWIALHLFYIMLLVLFAWMHANGYGQAALPVCEGLYGQLSWIIPACEVMMVPVFVYWFFLEAAGRTVFPRWMALTNLLVFFAVLRGAAFLLPVSAFRLGFTNGLMSESMAPFFIVRMLWLKWKGNDHDKI